MYLPIEDRARLSTFTGPGGIEYMEYAAWIATDCIEYDKDACATLRKNFRHTKVHECDIRKLPIKNLSRRYYPVMTHTYPCDHYSEYANVHGAQNGDDLFLHCLRTQALLWPELMIIENVLGMRKFPVVMELWRNLPHYYTTEIIVRGEQFSLMKKSRVFLILHRQPFKFSDINDFLADHEIPWNCVTAKPGRKLKDYLLPMDVPGPEWLPYIEKRLDGGYRDLPQIYDPEQTEPINLPTNYKRDRGVALVKDTRYPRGVRPFAPEELAALHTFDKKHQFIGGINAVYRQIMDSVMPSVAYALGVKVVNPYFDAIEELMPQPKSRGFRFVVSKFSENLVPTDPLLHDTLPSRQSIVASVAPLPTNLVQSALL